MNVHLQRLRANPEPLEDFDDSAKLGINRQAKPGLMLSLRLKNGDATAFSYSHLYQVSIQGGQEITLTFSDHVVTLRGKSLATLYDNLLRHVQTEVVEMDELQARAQGREGVVVGIEVSPCS